MGIKMMTYIRCSENGQPVYVREKGMWALVTAEHKLEHGSPQIFFQLHFPHGFCAEVGWTHGRESALSPLSVRSKKKWSRYRNIYPFCLDEKNPPGEEVLASWWRLLGESEEKIARFRDHLAMEKIEHVEA